MPKISSHSNPLAYEIYVSESSEDEAQVDSESVESIKTGTPQEYTGQVKNLVRMYEKFAKAINSGEVKARRIVHQPTPSDVVDEDGARAPVNYAHGKARTKPSTEQRLSSLETKVGAIVNFISEMVACEVEMLGSNYMQHVKTLKNIDILKTSVKGFDDELDEVHEQLEEVETGCIGLRKENKRFKAKLKQLEQIMSFGTNELHNDMKLVSKYRADLAKLLEQVTVMLDRMASVFPAAQEQVMGKDESVAGEKGVVVEQDNIVLNVCPERESNLV